MKLKIELFRYGTLVFGKVLEQDESLRQELRDDVKTIASTNDRHFKVQSVGWPALDDSHLYIRGRCKESDNRRFACLFDTEDKAISACKNIRDLVAEINAESGEPELPNGVVRVM